ncbi:MAG: HIRAN domain protein [Deltaproteobacteria bacterium ADurb.BinA179]|jgi:hypothetical protein|nr:HIRAN domain-containing protein [Deltaproteobacteria bacterium]MDI9543900.1 HIRAN domain-containing protein [Pseudomonadota bacterium]OPZ28876.1 MAG: HIRAN domain protein [Deltaproteobacteria bacterium ADurb.BinA179]HOD72528.1 HIRAN domain-containing protein [Deltaproteobacteria bacterium]HOS27732.1 HIRAN domain-containing protein [Deltaproteobacteria bacterium]
MHRRTFVKLFACLPLIVLGPLAGSLAQGVPRSGLRSVPLLDTHVAGFRYYEGGRVWDYIDQGDALELRREPLNPHDAKATALYWREHKLGYIPRADNAPIAGFLDHGVPLKASVTRKSQDRPAGRCLQVEVRLDV